MENEGVLNIYDHLDFDEDLRAKGNDEAIQKIVIDGALGGLRKFREVHRVRGFDFDALYADLEKLLTTKNVMAIAA